MTRPRRHLWTVYYYRGSAWSEGWNFRSLRKAKVFLKRGEAELRQAQREGYATARQCDYYLSPNPTDDKEKSFMYMYS